MKRVIFGAVVALGLMTAGCRDDEATGGGGQAGGQTPASQNAHGTPGFTPEREAGPREQAPGGENNEQGEETQQQEQKSQ